MKGDQTMKVKIFGSYVKDYEATAERWFAENQDLEVKHVAIALNHTGDWVLSTIFYEEKEMLTGLKNNISQ
jgi:hypothetical protein